MKYLSVGLIGLCFFLLVDIIFLRTVMGPWYSAQYPDLLRQVDGIIKVNYVAALACYLLMLVCLTYFVFQLPPGSSWALVIFQGFLLGVTFYGVFDLTNLAILSGWSWLVSIVEILWGGIVCGATYAVMFMAIKIWQ